MQPAAVLSILVKSQGVASTAADLRSLDKAGRNAGAGLQKTEGHARKASKSFSVMGAAAKTTGLLVGGAGLVKGLQLMNSEYREAQKVGAQTNAVLKSTGQAANVTKKQIQDLANAISKKAGIDDEAIQKGENLLLTFRDIRNETGKGNDIFNQATQAITDVSVAMDQGLKQSAIQVGKALNDPIKGMTALKRIGVTFSQAQVDTVKKLVDTGDKLGAQKVILRELNKEFAGSAAAQATAGDKLKVAWNNLAEAAGGVLVPLLDKAAVAMTNLINQFVEGRGIATFIIPVFQNMGTAIAGSVKWLQQLAKDFEAGNTKAVVIVSTVSGLAAAFITFKTAMMVAAGAAKVMAAAQVLLNIALDANPVGAVILTLVALGAAFTVAYQKSESFRVAVLKVTDAALGIITTMIDAEGQVARLAGSLIPGRDAMDKFADKAQVAADRLNGLRDRLREQASPFHDLNVLAKSLGDSIAGNMQRSTTETIHFGDALKTVDTRFRGVQDAANSALGNIAALTKPLTGKIGKVGDGIGFSMGGGPAGKGSAALLGANSSLGPIAGIGSSFGLHVSSGRRPGAITSSGNVSYHSTGEAIDEAGPPAGMMAFFKTMKSRYGSRLAELIYGPGKIGIKNGQPFNFGPALNAQHMDHVHVALDTGKPGPGDGIGKARRAGRLMGDGTGKLGLQALANLWVKAGGSPKIAGLMARVAQAESGGNPDAKNPSGATGLWQILGAMVNGNLTDPMVNARNAVAKYKSQGLGAWAASRGAWGKYLGHPGVSASKTAAKRSAAAAKGKINPFDQKIASADVAIAQTKTTGSTKVGGVGGRRVSNALAAAGAVRAKEKIVGARIQKIRAALKGKLTPATRLRLTQELAQQVSTHSELGKQVSDLLHPAAAAATDPANPPTAMDFGNAQLAMAQLTPGTADDLAALQGLKGTAEANLATAQASGDPRQVTDAATTLKGIRDSIDSLTGATDDLNEQIRITNEKLALQATLAQEALRKYNVSQSDYGTLQKALAQIVSGELGGKIGLGFMTPGFSGGGSRY